MGWPYVHVSVLLICLALIGSARHRNTEDCLSQPKKIIWQKSGTSVSIVCKFECEASMEVKWFVFKEACRQLHLDDGNDKYNQTRHSLLIKSLSVNDSGTYYCAAVSKEKPAPGKQFIASGTTLVVKGQVNSLTRILLWSSFVLLAIYSIIIIIIIIQKKTGSNISFCKKTHTTHKNNHTKKRQFQDVVQELHIRGKKHTHPSPNEVASDQITPSTDDIYENV
ncbi:uncharacterized protein LOC143011604 [Genypterus blacodes]|uniref:uncharacterized protein LOC143011604 n=1 Tax=Genypterus blacodes TaxID=154954 RepID=UPI003F763D83